MHFVNFSGGGFAGTAAGKLYIYLIHIKLKYINSENKIEDPLKKRLFEMYIVYGVCFKHTLKLLTSSITAYSNSI